MTSSSLPVSSRLPDDPKLQAIISLIAAAECCWFGSVRPDGRAHLAPIWHVWHADQLFVVTQSKSVRARNILHNPSVSIALPDPLNAVIVEGEAHLAPDAQAALQPLFLAKYNWDIVTDHEYDAMIAITPHKIMTWGSHGDQRWKLR
jgi:general stress protein 26